MKDNRPVNLDLSTIHFPITAIVSITTRITGVVLFVAAAIMLYLLDMSLSGEAGFAEAQQLLSSPLAKLVIWGILAAVIYHAIAGLKHIVADFGYGESLEGGVLGSQVTFGLSIVLIIAAGIWIW